MSNVERVMSFMSKEQVIILSPAAAIISCLWGSSFYRRREVEEEPLHFHTPVEAVPVFPVRGRGEPLRNQIFGGK